MNTSRATYILRGLALATTLALAPFTLTKEGVAESKACSQTELETGTCCSQARAICNAGAGDNVGYCYRTSGSCASGSSPCS
jgi:hypothetical protein